MKNNAFRVASDHHGLLLIVLDNRLDFLKILLFLLNTPLRRTHATST